jgi:hypothetical protein
MIFKFQCRTGEDERSHTIFCDLYTCTVHKDKYLTRLEAECRAEELKARIRGTKMMSQGITYSQMVEGPPPSRSSTGPRRTTRHPDCSHSGRGN